MIIEMKATEQYFHLVLFVMLYIVESKKPVSLTIQMKAIEQCFPMVLFTMLYRMNVKYNSVINLTLDLSNKEY